MRPPLLFLVISMSSTIGFIPTRPLKEFNLKLAKSPSQADLDNHANQMNPNNDAYWDSRDNDDYDQDDLDNHSNQMNPNNDAYDNDDNHANQMNPNNDAYSSSRGH